MLIKKDWIAASCHDDIGILVNVNARQTEILGGDDMLLLLILI